jgi:hypothetical protein
MAVDQSKVGTHMAEQMEAIEEAYRDVEGEFEIGDICTIVEVRGKNHSDVRMRPNISSTHGLLGLLKMGELIALSQMQGRQGE